MARRKKRAITENQKKRLSKGLKARWARLKELEAQQSTTIAPNDHAAKKALEHAAAACAGYCLHAIDDFARRAGVPSGDLAQWVAPLISGKAVR